jgi:nicotinamidase-related amidase
MNNLQLRQEIAMNTKIDLVNNTRPFLVYLGEWYAGLESLPLSEVIGGEPERVAILSIDVINGFCKSGALASERVGRIARPVADVFAHAYNLGVRNFALIQEAHHPSAIEFESYPPHGIAGTEESEAVDELKALPFFKEIAVFRKNTIHPSLGNNLDAWLAERPDVDRFIQLGDCTDICVYQSAMYLKLLANAANIRRRVIVPADAVETFDSPVEIARDLGIKAHDGDLHHVLFLHHLALNGVEVVQKLT